MSQPDLFDVATSRAPATCGGCVHRNGHAETLRGHCPWHGDRHKDDPACADGFRTIQLNAALYGRKLTIK